MRNSLGYLGWRAAAWLALLLLLVAIPLRLQQRQQSGFDQIDRLGGRVSTTQSLPAWLRRLVGRRSLLLAERATVVNLSRTEVDDSDLACLQDLIGVERLNLSGTSVTDAGLQRLNALSGLKALDLNDTQISDEGLAALRQLTELEYLYLSRTGVTDAGAAHLEALPGLRHLAIDGTAITARRVERFRRRRPDVDVSR